MKPNDPNDLDWLAFCYLQDEMTASERESFEQRLLVDQHARERLADAVELSQAMRAAAAHPASPALRTAESAWFWKRVAAAAVMVAAASLAIVILQWSQSREPHLAAIAQGPLDAPAAVPHVADDAVASTATAEVSGSDEPSESVDLAEIWAMQLDGPLLSDATEAEPADEADWTDADDDQPLEGWMLEAVDASAAITDVPSDHGESL